MKPKPVEVTWTDSSAKGGWRSPSEEIDRAYPISCTSVGYLIHRDEERLVLVQTHSEETEHGDEGVADSLAIPAVAVRKVRRLS